MVFVLLALVMGCAKDKKVKENQEVDVVQKNNNLDHVNNKVNVSFSDVTIAKVYTSYLSIKGALVNSDSKQVREEAKKLSVINKDLKGFKELKAVVKLISLTKDTKKQRDFFATLTTEFEKLIKTTTIESGEIYKQFCPMAFEGEGGYWFSNSREIRNPYFGKEMLLCGSVEEVFK